MMDRPSTRRRWLMGGSALGAAALVVAGKRWWKNQEAQALQEVQEAPPDFWLARFPRPEGGELSMQAFLGRPLVVNFWATWCPPCVRELPLLDEFARSQATQALRCIALAIDGVEQVQTFIRRTPIGVPVGVAGTARLELVRQLGNAQAGLPFTVLLDAQGRQIRHRLGEITRSELDSWAKLVQT